MTVSSVQARSLGSDAVVVFRLRGGTIGRGRDNDWVLPDPSRIVSSHHARTIYDQGVYYIEDTSANGTSRNRQDELLPKGQPVALEHGDTLYIGEYEIQVELIEETAYPSAPVLPSTQDTHAVGQDTHASDPTMAGPGLDATIGGPALDGTMAGHDFVAKPYVMPEDKAGKDWIPPMANELGPPGDEGASRFDHLAADKQHFRPATASPEPIPEDMPQSPGFKLPDDWMNEDASASFPAPERVSVSEPAAARQPPSPPADTQAPVQASAPAAVPAARPEPAPVEVSEPAKSIVADDHARARPESQPEPTAVATIPPPTAPSPSIAANGGEGLISAFFEGLGLKLDPGKQSLEDDEALLRQIGRLLRILTQGTMEVLQTRTKLKDEFRLSQTRIRPAEFNPLKFSINAEQALKQFFVERPAGLMGAEEAFTEAMKDISLHEMAVIAGMRAAFDSLLEKLAPEAVEAALRADGKRGSLLPFSNKTWDYYRSFYAEFRANANDDFQGFFGEDFVRAYENQVSQLAAREKGR